MSRFLALFSIFLIMSSVSNGQSQDQGPGEFVSFFGHHYLTPGPNHPCASASFNDHGQSVTLCVDSLGRPIEVDPNFVESQTSSPDTP